LATIFKTKSALRLATALKIGLPGLTVELISKQVETSLDSSIERSRRLGHSLDTFCKVRKLKSKDMALIISFALKDPLDSRNITIIHEKYGTSQSSGLP
jgi:hypothetical protein